MELRREKIRINCFYRGEGKQEQNEKNNSALVNFFKTVKKGNAAKDKKWENRDEISVVILAVSPERPVNN